MTFRKFGVHFVEIVSTEGVRGGCGYGRCLATLGQAGRSSAETDKMSVLQAAEFIRYDLDAAKMLRLSFFFACMGKMGMAVANRAGLLFAFECADG